MRHQAHSTRNLARKRGLKSDLIPEPVRESRPGCEYTSSDNNGGKLKVRPTRHFTPAMSFFSLDRTEQSIDFATNNPVNQLGPVFEQQIPVVTSNDFKSFMAAFAKRCNFIQEGDEDDIDDLAFKEACAVIDALPDLFQPWDENQSDRERWMSKFDLQKRRDMEAALATLPDSMSPSYLGQKDLSVKQEVLIKRDDPTWAPRVIYAGNDHFNTWTGPASMVVMERMVQLTGSKLDNPANFAVPIGPIMTKFAYKTDDVSLCRHICDPDYPEHVEGDFSRNDREQRRRVALLYDRWLGKLAMPSWFRRLLLQLETFTVRSRRYGLRAQLKYQLPTGTTSTTPRNSAYNATMFAVACKRQKVKSGKSLILGDDILAALKHRLKLNAWVKTVADFKMVLKAKAPALNGEATFLSRRFITDHEHPFMLPLLGKMLVRFNVRGTHNEACSDSKYMAGKALSYAFECRHVPLLRNLFLDRFNMEDSSDLSVDDLSFYARRHAGSIGALLDKLHSEPVTVSDDTFGFWCCEFYDSDICEIKEIFTSVVLSNEVVVLDDPRLHRFAHDYS
jgi:hypothetical protein